MKSRGAVPEVRADGAGEIKRIVVVSNGKAVCALTGQLLSGTQNPASFFTEFGASWVGKNTGVAFSTFVIEE